MDAEALKAAGWKRIEVGGFTDLAGPVWKREEQGDCRLGLLIEERHCNNHIRTVHGGVVMTLADIGLGFGMADVLGEQRFNCVTASLQTQFIAVARMGEFLTCHPEVIRHTRHRQLVFIRGLIRSGDRVIASAEGIWNILEERPPQ